MAVTPENLIKEPAREPQSYLRAPTNAAGPPRIKYLRIALRLIALIFIFGIYTLGIVWPSGWVWHTGHSSHYLEMILGVYATLGVFLWIASRGSRYGPAWYTLASWRSRRCPTPTKSDIYGATSRPCLSSPLSLPI